MHPTPRDFIGAGLLAVVLFALVLVFFAAGFGAV
jgi:hypothetical protein